MNSDTHRGWRGLGTISLDTERQLWSARTAHGLRKALVSTYWFITKDNIGANPDEKDTRAGMGGRGPSCPPQVDHSPTSMCSFLVEVCKSYHLQCLYGFHYLGTKD